MNENRVIIDATPIKINKYYDWLSQSPIDGAIVTFTGKVRSEQEKVQSLYLEHYHGMTETVMVKIMDEARQRWQINRAIIVHRIGHILANELIVFVGVSSLHRHEAFVSTQFIMDKLKNDVPLWKKEKTLYEESWVEVKKSDRDSLKKWY